jgi:hypothetical protein
MEWKGNRLVASGEIEVIEKFQRSYRLVRTPLKSVPADVLRRAAPECRYLVMDSNGRAVGTGAATLGTEAGFQIDVTDRLPPGNYTLSVLMA